HGRNALAGEVGASAHFSIVAGGRGRELQVVAVQSGGDGLGGFQAVGVLLPRLVHARKDERVSLDFRAGDRHHAAAAPKNAAFELRTVFRDAQPTRAAAGDGQGPPAQKRIFSREG